MFLIFQNFFHNILRIGISDLVTNGAKSGVSGTKGAENC